MPTTSGTGMAVMGLLSLVGVVQASRSRARRGVEVPGEDEADPRMAATLEAERRMAAYLAARDDARR